MTVNDAFETLESANIGMEKPKKAITHTLSDLTNSASKDVAQKADSTVTPRPRKKLSFKEPEIFSIFKRKSLLRKKPPALARTTTPTSISFDESVFREENEDLEELEVQKSKPVDFFEEVVS